MSLLPLLDEGLDVGRDYFFHGLLLLVVGVWGGWREGCGGDDGEPRTKTLPNESERSLAKS